MEEEKKDLRAVVNLLEKNGYHVFKAEEESMDALTAIKYRSGTIHLRIAPYEESKKC
jgi:hypothetical protein